MAASIIKCPRDNRNKNRKDNPLQKYCIGHIAAESTDDDNEQENRAKQACNIAHDRSYKIQRQAEEAKQSANWKKDDSEYQQKYEPNYAKYLHIEPPHVI